MNSDKFIINYNDLKIAITDIFTTIGMDKNDAELVADVLVEAELRGIPSHGLVRVKDYLGLWQKNRLNINAKPKIIRESLATALVDGDNGLGMISGDFAMNLAISKAQNAGCSVVVVNNSNHFGIAGYYAIKAVKHDMIGIAMTNANPTVAPTFAKQAMLGTNPIAFAMPTQNEPIFLADFATVPIARGKVELLEKQGKTVPEGMLQNADGIPTTDPSILRKKGMILPLGGDYEHAGYKGYCLTAIVDILTAVLSGANFGNFVPPQVSYLPDKDYYPGKGLGHFFAAIKLDAFRPANEVKKYMDLWIKTMRAATPIDPNQPVLIPNDPEVEKTSFHKKNGIPILPEVINELKQILNESNIHVPDKLSKF